MSTDTTQIGLGPVMGTIYDRRRKRMVPLRTRPGFVDTYARGYAVEGDRITLRGQGQGTQFWFQRSDALHRAEDVYKKPGSPIYAPFAGRVENIYKARSGTFQATCDVCGVEYGDVIVLRSTDDPRIALRLIHLHHLRVNKGDVVRAGEQLAVQYTDVRFPGADPSHSHVEAVVQVGEDANATKGTHQPFSVFDVEALYNPGRAYGGGRRWGAVVGAVAVALGLTGAVWAVLELEGDP